MKPRIQRVLTPWNPGFTASDSGSDSGSTVGGHGFGHTSQVPSSVFFELLSLDHLIAMTDLEVTRNDKELAALRRFGSDGALASAEQASRPCSTPSATTASEIVNRSARESVLMSGTEAAIAGAVASPQCFPADTAVELWLPPFSISRRRR